jgi:hypothetical protein
VNDRLIDEFLTSASQAPVRMRGKALVALVAEHCAKICDTLAEEKDGCVAAAETMRAAFVGLPEPKATAVAARLAVQ